LASTKRPAVLSTWLLSKNRAHYSPEWSTDDVAKFAEDMVSWWGSVQPKWRQTDSGLPLPDYSRDLSVLRKGGKSGICCILLGLRWWGLADRGSDVWKAMLADVNQCLEQLKGSKSARTRGRQAGDSVCKGRAKKGHRV
ncbi:hypothetical protein IW262DRAFT_1264759, partial [Armillaria fumosa]